MVAGKRAGEPTKKRQTGPKADKKKNGKAESTVLEFKPDDPPSPPAPKAKAESPPPAGHNSGELSAEDRRYLKFRYRDTIANLKDRLASLNGTIRAEFKKAKAEGFTKSEIEKAIKAMTPEGRLWMLAEVQEIHEELAPYPEGTQFELDLERPPELTTVTAAREGRLAFDNNEAATGGRWAPGSPEHQAWLDAWHDKQARRVRQGIKPLPAANDQIDLEEAIAAAPEPVPASEINSMAEEAQQLAETLDDIIEGAVAASSADLGGPVEMMPPEPGASDEVQDGPPR